MAAPTPVSAYLHAAAMVKAGVYLVALLGPGVRRRRPSGGPCAGRSASRRCCSAAGAALRQNDLKLLLAYGTVSQLGFLVAGASAPAPRTRPSPAWRHAARARACSRRRCSSSSASSTTPPAPATCASSRGLRPARCPSLAGVAVAGRRVDGRRCRRCSASSPRRPRSRRCSTGRGPRPPGWAAALAGSWLGSALTVAYSAAVRLGRLRRQARRRADTAVARRAGPVRSPRPPLLAVARPGRSGSPAVGLIDRAARAVRRPVPGRLARGRTTWRCGTASARPLLAVGRRPRRPASRCSSARGTAGRRLHRRPRRLARRRARLPSRSCAASTGSPSRSPARTQRGSLPVYLGIILLVVVPGLALARCRRAALARRAPALGQPRCRSSSAS